MNSLIYIVLISIDINVSEFIGNSMRFAFDPYTSLFGNLTWGFIFGFMGAGVFVGSKSQTTTFTYLVIVAISFAIILPDVMIGLFGVILAFIGTTALYVAFVTSRHA